MLEKTLMLGKIEGKRRRGRQRIRLLVSPTDSMDMNLSKLQEIVENREAWHAAGHGVTKSQTHFSNWTTTKKCIFKTQWDITGSEISQWQKHKHCDSIVWFSGIIETESELVVARGWERGDGELLLNGPKISVGEDKKYCRDGWKWWLYNHVNVLDATELYT